MRKSNKLQLNESVTRRFMKLANLDNLSETFVQERYHEDEEMEEVKTSEQEAGRVPAGTNRALDELDDSEMDNDEEVSDMDAEMSSDEEMPEDEPAPSPELEAEVEDLVKAIADAISVKTGVDVSVSSDEEMPVEEPGEPEEMSAEEPPLDSEEEMELSDEEDLQEENSVKSGAREAVAGAPSPKAMKGSHPDHKMKDAPATSKNMLENLERVVMAKVLQRLKEEFAASKNPKKKNL